MLIYQLFLNLLQSRFGNSIISNSSRSKKGDIIWLKFPKVQTHQISPPTNPIKEQKSGDSSNNLILRKGRNIQLIIIHDILLLTWRSSGNRWRDWWQSLSSPTWTFNVYFPVFQFYLKKLQKIERNWMAWFFFKWYQPLEPVPMWLM